MRAATIVTLLDDDGDEFPVRLDGAPRDAEAAYAAALNIAEGFIESRWFIPNGQLRPGRIEQVGQEVAATQEP